MEQLCSHRYPQRRAVFVRVAIDEFVRAPNVIVAQQSRENEADAGQSRDFRAEFFRRRHVGVSGLPQQVITDFLNFAQLAFNGRSHVISGGGLSGSVYSC